MAAHWTRTSAALSLLALGPALLLLNCDNGATGVDACRQIEGKRCAAVVGCPGISITTEADVIQCQQLYNDQCLFGMADAADPDQRSLDDCLAAIDAASACKGSDNLGACTEAPALSVNDPSDVDACLVLLEPQRLLGCSFLLPPDQQPSNTAATTSSSSSGMGGMGSGGMGGMGSGGMGGAG